MDTCVLEVIELQDGQGYTEKPCFEHPCSLPNKIPQTKTQNQTNYCQKQEHLPLVSKLLRAAIFPVTNENALQDCPRNGYILKN